MGRDTYIDPTTNTSEGHVLAEAGNAASAFLNFQAKIDMVMTALDEQPSTEIDMLTGKYQTLKKELDSLKSRVDRLTGAIGADNPNFQTKDRTTADGTSFSE